METNLSQEWELRLLSLSIHIFPYSEQRLSEAFIRNPPKDSLIVPIDVSAAEEISIDSLKSITDLDQSGKFISLRLIFFHICFRIRPIAVRPQTGTL